LDLQSAGTSSPISRRQARSLLLVAAIVWRIPAADAGPPSEESATSAHRQETVIGLQADRTASSAPIEDGSGRRGRATLIDLNPHVHAWFLLTLEWDGDGAESYHLENPDAPEQRVQLDPGHPFGVVLDTPGGAPMRCDLWSVTTREGLAQAKASPSPYAPLCRERLYLRQQEAGHRTMKERAADLLRDHVWGGQKITELVRDTLFKDAWLEKPALTRESGGELQRAGEPAWAEIAADFRDERIEPSELGLGTARESDGRLGVGRWYPVTDNPGIFVSAVTPRAISPDVMTDVAHPVNPLDPIEADALVYLVAFELDRFELGFALGTEHPRVDWSDRVLPQVRDPSLPGPDGIGTIAPLVRTGMLSPAAKGRVAATFTGGFKRLHGAMHWGALAHVDHGSHYGFVENGVVLSRLQPGLATVLGFDDGRVELETWSEADERELARVRFARQNGVALVERDAASGRPEPGALVTQWGPGNWSGSEDKRLRTLRAGLCLQEHADRRFLVYGYFSSATPSAMATVFQGYGCRYAMLLDMNALEHTYLALYRQQDGRFLVQHLIQGMEQLDQSAGGQYLPRFVAFPDNRDFFYLLRRKSS